MSSKITAMINTFNEEHNIRKCLECVKWADEIIVVDMHSEDRTVEIAREYTDRVLPFERMGYCEPARQFGIDSASNEWVLVLDADELVNRPLRDRLIEIADSDKWDVVFVPRKNFMFGRTMEGTGFGPMQDSLARLFRKNMLHWPAVVHCLPEIDERARVLRIDDESCALQHFQWADVEKYQARLNFYTTVQARDAIAEGRKFTPSGLLKLAAKEFIVRYFRNKGYKDGSQGLAISIIMAGYQASIGLKTEIMRQFGTDDPAGEVAKLYEQIADEIIAGHGGRI